MATVTFRKELTVNLNGELPAVGHYAPDFDVVKNDLSTFSLSQVTGKRIVLNIFPSIDTGTCAQSVREFNKRAAGLDNTLVLCVSKDLPFAQSRFCGAEGIDNVMTVSAFRNDSFEKAYGVLMEDGPLKGLLARAVVVVDEHGKVVHTELVKEIADEPNYEAALAALR